MKRNELSKHAIVITKFIVNTRNIFDDCTDPHKKILNKYKQEIQCT